MQLTLGLPVTQLPVGSTFKDPGYYAFSNAPGNSNPVTVTSRVARGQSAVPPIAALFSFANHYLRCSMLCSAPSSAFASNYVFNRPVMQCMQNGHVPSLATCCGHMKECLAP